MKLGDRDATTGWYAKEYDYSTIEMLIVERGSQRLALELGYFVALDGLGFTLDTVQVGDLIFDASGRTWEVKTVKPQVIGDVLKVYTCDLKEMPLYG